MQDLIGDLYSAEKNILELRYNIGLWEREMQMRENENIFEISIEQVQAESKKLIGRKLADDEIFSVKKGIESGLLFDIETVFKTAIENATEY